VTELIMEAERRTAQMQAAQLDWAETSPEAEAALRAARTRAVLRVAARLNATVDQLHQLRVGVDQEWSAAKERSGDLSAAVFEWSETYCNPDTNDQWEVESISDLIEVMWPDVVLECDEWARRVVER
jgi:hypothetical protein